MEIIKMTTNEVLSRHDGQGWQRGFWNLIRKELKAWWGTGRWWLQGLLWAGSLNGLLFVALFLLPPMMRAQGESVGDPLVMGGQMFFSLGMLAVAVGVIVMMQGAILDEKTSGTAAWILSKPVTRGAFLLSKLLANAVSMFVLLIFVPALVAYAQFVLGDTGIQPVAFLVGVGLLALHTIFYLTLTLLLGVVSENRGAVLGIALGMLLGGTLFRNLWPLSLVTPWLLPDLVVSLFAQTPLPGKMYAPILVTAAWSVFFVIASVWRFKRQEL
jgi:ABC-2 type transport system permease protein